MSTATITVGAALDSALRREFSNASIRLRPETRMTDVIASLSKMGVVAELQDDVLVLRQERTQMHTTLALRTWAKMKEHEQFIVVEGQHPYQWSREKKIEFLRTHSDDEYRALIQQPVLDSGVKVLDANMSREDYDRLTTKEKVLFVKTFGEAGVRRVMSKPRKAAK